jgi:hypothetical protein
MDEVGNFSVTSVEAANEMARHIELLDGISHNSTITDATACVGGNTLAFSRHFRNVNAIEMDADRFVLLQNNVAVFTEDSRRKKLPRCNLRLMKGDCLDVCSQMDQDVIFLDPPWGGVEYSTSPQNTDTLGMSGMPLHVVCRKLAQKCKYVALKLPFNVDDSGILRPDDGIPPIVHIKVKITKKTGFIVLSYDS